jgi:uncharacterized membrane protein YedE/YeeE
MAGTTTGPATLSLPAGTRAAGAPRRSQPGVVAAALGVLVAGAAGLAAGYGPRQGALFVIGAGLGLVLCHAGFGFTRAYRDLVTTGDGRLFRAQMLMVAVATVLFAPVLATGRGLGVEAGGAFAPVSLSVLVGAFVFAIGMQLGGGCGSGTLYHLGAGTSTLLFTLAGFLAGSVIGTFHMPFWWAAPSLEVVSLGHRLGWGPAVAVQLGACAALAALSWAWERRRPGRAGPSEPETRGWARVVHGPWSITAGAVALAGLNLATLLTAGHAWSITWAFSLWGGKILRALGVDLSGWPFWQGGFQRAALEAPVWADVTSVMDLGLVVGACLGAGLAGRFARARHLRARPALIALGGGLLLGYGARIAYGCNIGAFFSGAASTSLHGWLWLGAALLGTPIGVRLRRDLGLDPPAAPVP